MTTTLSAKWPKHPVTKIREKWMVTRLTQLLIVDVKVEQQVAK